VRVCLQPDFRIAVTGSVVELDKAVTIVKKLKLQGTPYKIYKNTAFIQVLPFSLCCQLLLLLLLSKFIECSIARRPHVCYVSSGNCQLF